MRTSKLWIGIGGGALGAALCLGAVLRNGSELAFSYLAAFGFVASTLAGGLALFAILLTVGARWFVALRNVCLPAIAPVLLLPVLFLPVALTLRRIYPWAGSPLASSEAIAATQRARVFGQAWMSPGLFLARAAFYLLIWLVIAELFRRAALSGDRTSWVRARRSTIAALSLPALLLVGSWSAFDWLMSAVPEWNMTSVGLYLLTGGFASAVGVAAVLVHRARTNQELPEQVGSAHSLALGRLLFAATCLWAYVAVSQLIIVWIANIPAEAAFYVPRAVGSWRSLAAVLIFGHFAVPFLLLLSRKWKQRSAFVAALGAWIVLMHAVDLYWLVVPSAGLEASVFDAGPFLLLSALVLSVGAARARASAQPVDDSDLARSLGYESP